jgi:hypothetical protein
MDALDLQLYVVRVGMVREEFIGPDVKVPVSEWVAVINDVQDLLRVAAACEGGLALLQRIAAAVEQEGNWVIDGGQEEWCDERVSGAVASVRRARTVQDALAYTRTLVYWLGAVAFHEYNNRQDRRTEMYEAIRDDVSRILTS